MDGVLIRDGSMVPGADRFLAWLRSTDRHFLVLTNNSLFTPDVLSQRLRSMGLDVGRDQLWTSALATARFVRDQRPEGRAFVIGESSMHDALSDVGYREATHSVDYVVLGETWHYSFEELTTAIRLVESGSAFVATNPETTGTSPEGPLPGCGALAALIESATGVTPYYVGKPNAVMIRDALKILGAHSSETVVVGDRMDTDIHAGTEAGIETVLVLTGVAQAGDAEKYAFRPTRVVASVVDLIEVAK